MSDPVRIAIAGVGGRMGRQVATAVAGDPSLRLVGGTARPGSPLVGRDLGQIAGQAPLGISASAAIVDVVRACDVVVDFTTPESTRQHLDACREVGRAIVVGTTGLPSDEFGYLREVASVIPVFFAANMSLGVNLLVEILPRIAQALADGYDVEIVEAHHRGKKDAPSGTALRLAEAIADALGKDLAADSVHGRSGIAPRRPGEIALHAVRAGGIVGEHTVLFASEGEQVEIKHRAYSRQTFALGALRAARFLAGKPAGLYSMRDLLS